MEIYPEEGMFYKVELDGEKIIVFVTRVCFERSVFEGSYLLNGKTEEREFCFHEILSQIDEPKEKDELLKTCGG